MPETFSKRLSTAGLVAGSCFGVWLLGSSSASAQQTSPTSTQPESTSPAETPDRSHVFDMGEIVVIGTPDGQPTVGGAILTSNQIWTFDRKSLDQAVNVVPGVVSTFD